MEKKPKKTTRKVAPKEVITAALDTAKKKARKRRPDNSAYQMSEQAKQLTPKKLAAFLQYFMETANVREACRRAKVNHSTIYRFKADNADFREAFKEAKAIAVENLEGEGFRRAMEGVLEPVYYKGAKVGSIRKYSDSVLIFLLKGNMKSLYGDSTQIYGDPDAPIKFDDVGRERAMAEIAEIFAANGIKPPVFESEGDSSVHANMETTSRPATASPRKPS